MKPKEFYKLMVDFVEEEKRWKALKEGDIIYEERCGGMEMEYCMLTIEHINVEERYVTARDLSGIIPTSIGLSSFLTKDEFKKLNRS